MNPKMKTLPVSFMPSKQAEFFRKEERPHKAALLLKQGYYAAWLFLKRCAQIDAVFLRPSNLVNLIFAVAIHDG